MDIHAIPIRGRYILYRPLLRRAFVGNHALAELAVRLGRGEAALADAPQDVAQFLESIHFLDPDPSEPEPLGRGFAPTMAVLLMTNRCSLRCTYCYANGGESDDASLPVELAYRAIDAAYAHAQQQGRESFDVCFHGGGEPTAAWGALREIVAYARSKPAKCCLSVVSNGVWSERQREWILEHFDEVSLSFDGRREIQDRQRPFASGRGSFDIVMRTIEALDRAQFHYGIRMTAQAPWDDLAQNVAFICQNTQCQGIQVEPAFNVERGAHIGPTRAQARAFARAFLAAFDAAASAGRSLTYSGARPELLTAAFCTAPYGALVVNPSGAMAACYEITSDNHPLSALSTWGQVRPDGVTLDEDARSRFLDYLDEQRARCRGCFCYWHCAGDCFTRRAVSGLDPENSPRCWLNREITAQLLLWHIMAGGGVWQGQDLRPEVLRQLAVF